MGEVSGSAGAEAEAPQRFLREGDGLAVAGVACGVLAFFAFGIILGTSALVLGALAHDVRPSWLAKSGFAAGIVALLWSFLFLAVGG
ncbi:hypothetical protein [Streptomyces xiaopingdaonensis]|uniref:hypothetical protein n=1 Tax=Streptomyces xiaopingdaonensis TaxID=1565415 RepID=UPI0002FC83A3|nr:hypothetical protein [Streptomyces xiaopingdaonensis]